MENTTIGWTTHTLNPWRGCTRVGADCENCYAEEMARRFPETLGVWGPGGKRVVASENIWGQPLKWNRDAEEKHLRWRHEAGVVEDAAKLGHHAAAPAEPERPRVFCASICDVFEEWVNDGHPRPLVDGSGGVLEVGAEFLGAPGDEDCLWWRSTPHRTRGGVGRLVAMDHARLRLFDLIRHTPHLNWLLLTKRPQNFQAGVEGALRTVYGTRHGPLKDWLCDWLTGQAVPDNVWVGCSAGYQKALEDRLPHLLKIPARIRFLSLEPLLGPLQFRSALLKDYVSWAIVGGESGKKYRPCDPAWVADVVRQCDAADVPVFVKQAGGLYPETQGNLSPELWARKEFPDA